MRHMLSATAAIGLLMALVPAQAQTPTPQEQAACRPDAQRFCASAIGKPPEMRACLEQNKPNLTPACRQVLESRGG